MLGRPASSMWDSFLSAIYKITLFIPLSKRGIL
jgi:hypothetical protein